MASYKNQHYVPRCYLKPFSLNSDGKAINLFNISREVSVPCAPVKSQCSSSYFYGRNIDAERALGKIEKSYGHLIRKIQTDPADLDNSDILFLKRFCFLQYIRTDSALKRFKQSMNDFIQIATLGDTADGSEEFDYARNALEIFSDNSSIIDDLKTCFIRNSSKKLFITSDDPAVMTNRWYAQHRLARGMSPGLNASGAMFVFPLTPRICCVHYDGDVYSISNTGGWVETDCGIDIDALNEHQVLHCLENLYFANWDERESLRQFWKTKMVQRPPERHEINVAKLTREDESEKVFEVIDESEMDEGGHYLMHLKTIIPTPLYWPRFLRYRNSPRIYSNGTGVGYVRRSEAERRDYSDRPFKRVKV
ncbi:DUF4238 domain-containing protein [Pacificispira sp.]|uniref:DUF4238 domain-containing protein n=1 Tax=Pacificispira sp. TaxID=2888761 RepID=UPI003B51F63B